MLFLGSQAILYFVSASLTYIAADLHTDVVNWLLTANTLAVAAICPFVGYMTDLLGEF
jgi:MFS family permease